MKNYWRRFRDALNLSFLSRNKSIEEDDSQESETETEPEPESAFPTPFAKQNEAQPQPESESDGLDPDVRRMETPNAAVTSTVRKRSASAAEEEERQTEAKRAKTDGMVIFKGMVDCGSETPVAADLRAFQPNAAATCTVRKRSASAEEKEEDRQTETKRAAERDEMVIFEGMIGCGSETPVAADLSVSHDFIKKNLQVDATRKRLKNKNEKKNKCKGRKDGENNRRTFLKAHEEKAAYQVSKIICGGNEAAAGKENVVVGITAVRKKASSSSRSKTKRRRAGIVDDNVVVNIGEKGDQKLLWGMGAMPIKAAGEEEECVEKRVIKAGEELFEGKGNRRVEWKKLRVEETELYLKRLELTAEQAKLLLDLLNSTRH